MDHRIPLKPLMASPPAGTGRVRTAFLWLSLTVICTSTFGGANPPKVATGAEIEAFFQSRGQTVLTFVGYSGAGYEDVDAMLTQARRILAEFEPVDTIVNVGATPEGIGAVYELARHLGFFTTGIVSTQARDNDVALSPVVDQVFYVEDSTWGGLLEGSDQLSPTSAAMVAVSDVMVGIGGGTVARDELIAARNAGKRVRFIPADMNHQVAREKALAKGLPEPTGFGGAAAAAF